MVHRSEANAHANVSDYSEAVRHLELGRWQELQRMFPPNDPRVQATCKQYGCTPHQLWTHQLNQDRITVAQTAIAQGKGVETRRQWADKALLRST